MRVLLFAIGVVVVLTARRIADAYGRNYVRDWFLRPGVNVRLANRTGRIVERRGTSRQLVVWVHDEQAQFFGRPEVWWMGNLRIALFLLLAVVSTACSGALAGGTLNVHDPAPAPNVNYEFGIVACAVPADVTAPCARPIVGAKIEVQHSDGWVYLIANGDGYALMNASIPFSAVRISADGFETLTASIEPPQIDKTNRTYSLTASHVDPSTYTLGQRAAVRGAIFPRANICADAPLLPYGPRPFQPDNIIATTYFDNYTSAQQDAIARCLKSVGFTHVAVGGLVDAFAYHGQYVGHDYSTDEGFEKFLDQHQWFYDHGLIPVTFIHRDGATLAETQAMMRRLVAAHPRARKLITIVIMSGWEPAKYEWSSCTWAGYVALGRELFPDALNGIHTVSDVDAPVGTDDLCNDDDKTWNPGGNGAGWKRVIDAGLHIWFIQNGPYEAAPTDPGWTDIARQFAAQFKKDGDGALYHGVAWHFGGTGGWTGDSAFGPGVPICLVAAENTAYEAYWSNRPSELARGAWGNLAVNSGACGYMDGGAVPVPVRR